jgi:hypothetical protein
MAFILCVANLPEWRIQFILVCAWRNSNPRPGKVAAFTLFLLAYMPGIWRVAAVEQSAGV